ncbi:MAG: cytochrome c oxidase assembly protein [Burkholderiales bacterium]|nr:cytochrome c oxidase assembly protein [Burkholderiales bacterium]
MSIAAQNQVTMKKLLLMVVLMSGFAFALVPMYRKICEVVGINDTRDVNFAAANSQVDLGRNVTVELMTAVNQNAPLRFEPVERQIKIHPGEIITIHYRIMNTTDHVLVGQAVPSYGPAAAAKYLTKLQCFCFAQQTFQPREVREMAVVFVVGRELPKDLNTITLAYTFFDITARKSG